MAPHGKADRIASLAILLALASCSHAISGGAGNAGAAGSGGQAGGQTSGQAGAAAGRPAGPIDVAPGGARRLTRFEYDNTLLDLLGDTSRAGSAMLPEDAKTPFDNDFNDQNPSAVLVASLESLASAAAERAVSTPAVLARIVPCKPSGPGDTACLRAFVTKFGRRALRRPLSDDEVGRYASLQTFAIEANDFNVAVGLVIQTLVQTPEFVYRFELGSPIAARPGLHQLGDFEIATRAAYFLIASTPSDALLDLAEAGQLHTPTQRRAAADMLFRDPRVADMVARYHSLWLGYISLPLSPELTSAMQAESTALVRQVVVDQNADYFDLFRSDQTFVNDLLAQHYGLPSPGAVPGWVRWNDDRRRGILSQGSVLSAYAKFNDTSVTQRGLFVRRRLMCQDVPPPPPNVDTNKPLTDGGRCKADRQRAHATGGCASCHNLMDSIGYGLENYDKEGRFRAHDDNAPDCLIDGQGQVVGVGAFNGPAALSALLIDSGNLRPCVVQQVYRYAMGRRVDGTADSAALQQIEASFVTGQQRFSELLMGVVAGDAFALAREKDQP
jgi:Protein of unknown function (DUF1588)/Protein of unknown function (DUF1592)/Protein of unknown function (DUF1595)/Protein of unknown function (DUF1585)/Protein of unknown function (DUF1587)